MLCEKCKIREANIKYTEVINGVKTEHNLCAQCAREMDFGPYSAIFDNDFPLGKLLSGLLGIGVEEQEETNRRGIVCPTCKTSYDEFVTNSCFGCQDCYSVFDPLIYDNIKTLQGSDRHIGKVPKFQREEVWKPEETKQAEGGKQCSFEEQISMMQARLKDALQAEDYEEAAVCRDKIRALKELAEGDKESLENQVSGNKGNGTTVDPESKGTGTRVDSESKGTETTVDPENKGNGTTVAPENKETGTGVDSENKEKENGSGEILGDHAGEFGTIPKNDEEGNGADA